ncbi:MAG TPA: hypothetical protein PLB51_00870 [Candidatus Paceibacterota bacterium]|nr:hypothetical protein [Candidatus Paceibacterota bacterium]
MSIYYKCPHCENNEEGLVIWTCGSCGCVHCKNCDNEGKCPKCDGSDMNQVGYVDPSAVPDSDDDEYQECPRCGNTDDGESIWRCDDCDCVHCKNCDPDNSCCPSCNSDNLTLVGFIH